MKDTKKTILMSVIILLIALLGLGGYKLWINSQKVAGQKHIIVRVINENENYIKEYKHTTASEILGEALDELKIIGTQEGEFGRWVDTVDGMKADMDKEEWWAIEINEEEAQTGIDNTPIKDGDTFEFKLVVGW